MVIRVNASNGNFFVASRRVAQDNQLTWEARGVLMYLLSKGDSWTVRTQDLINQGRSRRDAVRRILAELEEHGYLFRERMRNEQGKFEWRSEVYDEPLPIEKRSSLPSPGNPAMADPSMDNPSPVNPSIYKGENLKNKESESGARAADAGVPPSVLLSQDEREGAVSDTPTLGECMPAHVSGATWPASIPPLALRDIQSETPPSTTDVAGFGSNGPAESRQAAPRVAGTGKRGQRASDQLDLAVLMVTDYLEACKRPDPDDPTYVLPYSITWSKEMKAAKAILKDGWTSEQVVACYYWTKALKGRDGELVYRGPISLWTVRLNLGAWLQEQERKRPKRLPDYEPPTSIHRS
jgi:hypothetical protein